MKTSVMRSQSFHFFSIQPKITPKFSSFSFRTNKPPVYAKMKHMVIKSQNPIEETTNHSCHDRSSSSKDPKGKGLGRSVAITGVVSMGLVMMMMGVEDGHHNKAWALGPEGPMVEEFWENVRRYVLYALTVSTGVVYTVFQPIYELLKNPISAVLVLVIIGGTLFIVSQVLSAMVGVSDFSYDYGY